MRLPLATLALCALALGCARGAKPDQPIVGKLTIAGAKAVSPKELKRKIATSEKSWLPFTKETYFDRNVWRSDLLRLERYYQGRGYFQAKVIEQEVIPAGEDRVDLRVRVEEGEPTVLESLSIEGLEELEPKHRERLLTANGLSAGGIFVEAHWDALLKKLRSELVELGYVEAKVEPDAVVDLATKKARAKIRVTPNTRYRFGEVQVRAPPGGRVESWRIAEQTREAIEDERWYSESARAEAQARVFRMGVFGAAHVEPGTPSPEAGTVPLVVDVQEARFHSLRAGFGLSFEPARDDLHVNAQYVHRDFLGKLRRLQLQAEVGWAFIPGVLTVLGARSGAFQSEPVALLSADLEQPRFFHPNFRGNLRLEAEKGVEEGYSYYGGRGRVGIVWQPVTRFTLFPTYNAQLFHLTSGRVQAGDLPSITFGCEEDCLLSFFEQVVTFDHRDDPLVPREGFFFGVSLQEGGGPLGGTFTFLRVVPEARGYLSLLEDQRLTLSARMRVGSLIPAKGEDSASPIVTRFYSGGNAMRGFGTRRLAPQQLVESVHDSDYTGAPVPIGGNGLFEASMEARYQLNDTFGVATFVDSGFVTVQQLSLSPSYFADNLMVAVGLGVRYRTPVGPLRVDFAYRLPRPGRPLTVFPAEGEPLTFDPAQGCFGLGAGDPSAAGAPESPCAIHLTIGEAY